MEYEMIDRREWDRRQEFDFFTGAGCYISMTVDVDVTELWSWVRDKNKKFFIAMLYAVSRCMNANPKLRVGMLRGETPVRFDRIDPVFTALNGEKKFINATAAYTPDFAAFCADAEAALESARLREENVMVEMDNIFLATYVPVSFTTASMVPVKEILYKPVAGWGHTRISEGRTVLPFVLSCHHAFADGVDLAEFFAGMSAICENPAEALGI